MGITLLEVSLDDAEITANAPFSGRGSSSSSTESTTSDETDGAGEEIEVEPGATDADSGRNVPIVPLLAVAAVFVLAALAKRALSSSDQSEHV
jgi:cobalamin biosynthesis Mg chelatase CobN